MFKEQCADQFAPTYSSMFGRVCMLDDGDASWIPVACGEVAYR